MIINNILVEVFEIISDTDNYKFAMEALEAAYMKPTNTIYNRYQLITMKQQPAQTKNTFLQQLETQAKVCNFQAVTAEEKKNPIHASLLIQYDNAY